MEAAVAVAAAPMHILLHVLERKHRKFTYSEHVLDFILFINCIGNENFRDKMDWFSVLEYIWIECELQFRQCCRIWMDGWVCVCYGARWYEWDIRSNENVWIVERIMRSMSFQCFGCFVWTMLCHRWYYALSSMQAQARAHISNVYCSTLPMASPQNYINDRSWHVQMFAFLLCSYIKFMTVKQREWEMEQNASERERGKRRRTNNKKRRQQRTKIRATVRDAIVKLKQKIECSLQFGKQLRRLCMLGLGEVFFSSVFFYNFIYS